MKMFVTLSLIRVALMLGLLITLLAHGHALHELQQGQANLAAAPWPVCPRP